MTLEMDSCPNDTQIAATECHAVSSSSSSSEDDARHEAKDLGIFTLLSAAAHLDPSKLEDSNVEEQKASISQQSARCDASSNDAKERPDPNDNRHHKKRKAEISEVFDSDQVFKIMKIQPSPEEVEAATTDRTKNALLNWYYRLRELHLFKAKYGHAEVPQQFPENHALGIWVNKQRMQKKLKEKGQKVSLSEHRINLLNDLGFQWAKEKGDVSWDHHYNELFAFYLQHNHCNVPTKYTENKALGRWVSTQRSQLKKWRSGSYSLMTKDRYEKLCKLGFNFEMIPPSSKNKNGGSDSQNASLNS
ncbi:hypothetical protein FisN_11Hh160 [Fistulifera solaris]|uniref:Helicase-associated domain-containing protein n=1 Tax=Fistulifera solaris TaxID=1519565 RepID=A0A1Z5JKL4_FISSO|nr:hypothetical protein FisN_11Hh160 [Fistulifera solaris]|eukprot:GAX14382.1 hypothetical protein FisN_11Hh160 [Fistulifera solaris]